MMTKRIQILVVENDPHIRLGREDTLECEGYGVISAGNGRQSVVVFRLSALDLVVLDLMIPEMSGYDVCRGICKTNEAASSIMLTVKAEETDKVVGLELGTDDYVTKPFGIKELLTRIAAGVRPRAGDDEVPRQLLAGCREGRQKAVFPHGRRSLSSATRTCFLPPYSCVQWGFAMSTIDRKNWTIPLPLPGMRVRNISRLFGSSPK